MNDNYSTPRQNDNNLMPIIMIVIDCNDWIHSVKELLMLITSINSNIRTTVIRNMLNKSIIFHPLKYCNFASLFNLYYLNSILILYVITKSCIIIKMHESILKLFEWF